MHTVSTAEKRRVFAWIVLNVPYYGTSEVTDPDVKGGRQTYPAELDTTLATYLKRGAGVLVILAGVYYLYTAF